MLLGAFVAVGLAALTVGPGSLFDPSLRDTYLELRGARACSAFVAGAALSTGGVLVQGLFRNPLASPSILGTTAGASLGGQIALVLFSALVTRSEVAPELVVPLGCLLGALASLAVLLGFMRRGNDRLVLLLTGFVLSAFFLSMGSFLTSVAQESWELGRAVVAFSLGSVSGAGFHQVLFALPLVVVGGVASFLWGRPLDLMLSGENEAETLGVDVKTLRRWVAAWVSVLVAAAVSLGGGVSFVGLIVPHVLRPFAGVNHRRLIPASAFAGGTFLVACDVVGRLIPTRSEVPLGVVTGLIGAPVFLMLLIRTARGYDG